MINLNFTSCIDRFYTYRSAHLLATLWIDLEDFEIKQLSKYIEGMSYRMDNHICWKMKDGLCLSYSDHKLGIGTEIVEERW